MINSRALIVVCAFFLFLTALVIKLVDLQVINSEELKYYAKKQQTNLESIKAERGLIYDRNGVLLVHNRNDATVYVDLRMLSETKKQEAVDKFSKIFGKSKKHYLNILKGSGKTVCVEKKASVEKVKLLLNYKLNAMVITEDPTRIYQYGNLASHILGYVNSNYQGVNGVAKYFDSNLKGANGVRLVERNAMGDLITISDEQKISPVPGNNLVLTIEKSFQNILEEELKAGLIKYKGKSASGIIINPNNGEILALANVEDFDPNYFWKYDDFQRKNRVITDSYEPGSTFKAVTLAVLLNEDKCYENELVNVEKGTYKFRNAYIRDTHIYDKLTVRGILEESSNIGIAKLVQRIGDDDYFKYLRDFGFGNLTTITLPGEVKGNLRNPNDWSKLTKTFMSFGYGLSVTPLQLTLAFSAIINGGVLYEPQIIKKQISWDGKTVYENNPVTVRKVLSEKTSLKMKNLLTGVVQNGTGGFAKSEFISVGGKTGTSKIVMNGAYVDGKYNSSFVGFFPADNPEAVCLIVVNSPETEKYGGRVAAPIFKNVVERIIQAWPENFPNIKYLANNQQENKTTSEIKKLNNQKPDLSVLSDDFSFEVNSELVDGVMPDLKGKTIKETLFILNELGVKYKIKGTGLVESQSIKPGTSLTKKTVCVIDCSQLNVKGASIY